MKKKKRKKKKAKKKSLPSKNTRLMTPGRWLTMILYFIFGLIALTMLGSYIFSKLGK